MPNVNEDEFLRSSAQPLQNIFFGQTNSSSMPDINVEESVPDINLTPNTNISSLASQRVFSGPNTTSPNPQRSDISSVKLPAKIVPVGRPKGSFLTVIATKKKSNDSAKRKSSEAVMNSPAKRKFLDFSAADQSLKIVQWLTNKTQTEIAHKKVSYSDIIQDNNIFNRLRNYGINLKGIKNLVDTKCFSYLNSEVERLISLMWKCTKCKRNLSGEQIMCNGCFDWYHLSCVKSRQGKVVDPFFVGIVNIHRDKTDH